MIRLSTSAYGSCARLANGPVECWGYQSAGQLSLGAVSSSYVPVVVSKLSGVTQISQGYDYRFTCAVLNGQTVVCWLAGETSPTLIKTPLLAKPALTSASTGAKSSQKS